MDWHRSEIDGSGCCLRATQQEVQVLIPWQAGVVPTEPGPGTVLNPRLDDQPSRGYAYCPLWWGRLGLRPSRRICVGGFVLECPSSQGREAQRSPEEVLAHVLPPLLTCCVTLGLFLYCICHLPT